MNVKEGEPYDLSFYARTESRQTVTAQLESADGKKTYAKVEVSNVSGSWKRYACKMKADGTDPKARLTLCVSKPGTLWLDVVSLFPKTFKSRANGLRPDLVGLLQGLRPGFLRFPGGCVVEGVTLENRIQWKNTIGDIARRPGRWGLWGYHNTEGLGFHEYLQMCEDLDTEAMYVVNAGLSCAPRNGEVVSDPEELKSYIQDTLDALEYATGPVTSKWGAERVKNGRTPPFKIKYVEIGNENGGNDYFRNYRLFYDAIKAKHPGIITIADCPIPNEPVEIIDEHHYVAPDWFFANEKKYDSYDRKGPRIYVGEYAVTGGVGTGNLLGALSEASFMIGMERNSDVVVMASYAPLFENVNNREWPVNLIRFDSARSAGRTSYHVQTMFSAHRPDVTLATAVEEIGKLAPKAGDAIGIGTWDTQAVKLKSPQQKAGLYALGGKDEKTGQFIIKAVNPGAAPLDTAFSIVGASKLKPKAHVFTLAGDKPTDENTLDEPAKVVPVESVFEGVGPEFKYSLKPYSLTIFRIDTAK